MALPLLYLSQHGTLKMMFPNWHQKHANQRNIQICLVRSGDKWTTVLNSFKYWGQCSTLMTQWKKKDFFPPQCHCRPPKSSNSLHQKPCFLIYSVSSRALGPSLEPSPFPVCCTRLSMLWLTLHTDMMNSWNSCCLVMKFLCASFSTPFWPHGGSRVKASSVKSHLLKSVKLWRTWQ